MVNLLTLHVPQGEAFSPQAIWHAIDIHHGLLPQGDPRDMVRIRVLAPHTVDDFVNRTDARLAECIYRRTGNLAEVMHTADALADIVRFYKPLVRLQQCPEQNVREA